MKKKDAPAAKSKASWPSEQRERIRKACASDATYDRLKELVFDEAARIRNSDPRNLDPLAAGVGGPDGGAGGEEPRRELNVTVCSGRFILELPPGAENAFDGKRRLDAEVEYAAQAAVDGSGLVYQMDGAEPIIYRLATFGLNGSPTRLEAGGAAAPPARAVAAPVQPPSRIRRPSRPPTPRRLRRSARQSQPRRRPRESPSARASTAATRKTAHREDDLLVAAAGGAGPGRWPRSITT